MKFLNKSAIAVFVFGVVFAGSVDAATSYNVTSYQPGIMITGQDGGNYDLDTVTRMTANHETEINNLNVKTDDQQKEISAALNLAGSAMTGVQTNSDRLTLS
ncbi:hypothetical protein [Enterobacter pseudoroggenkampii]|uniref:hypothetical protein n=1 Tax=Enterobacter pseudoroggenkampii TaxID=2996112 RepID=UPI0038B37CBE